MSYFNLSKTYRGIFIVPLVYTEEASCAALVGKRVDIASEAIKETIVSDATMMAYLRTIKPSRLPLILVMQVLPERKPDMLNVGWIWSNATRTVSPVVMPLELKKVAPRSEHDDDVPRAVWSIKGPLATKTLTFLGPPVAEKYRRDEIFKRGLSNILVLESGKVELIEEARVKNYQSEEDSDTDGEEVDEREHGANIRDQEDMETDGEDQDDSSELDDETGSEDDNPQEPKNKDDKRVSNTNRKRFIDEPGTSGINKRGPGASGSGGGSGRPEPSGSNNLRRNRRKTHKLDGKPIYEKILNRTEVNARLFTEFFSRYFRNEIMLDMNKKVYKEISSFDAVHLLNHGAYMVKTDILTPKPDIVAAFTTSETLMPGVPNLLFLRRVDAQMAVRRYGTAIFSQAGIANLPSLNRFVTELSNADAPSPCREMRPAYNAFVAPPQAFDFGSIKKNVTLAQIRDADDDSNFILPLNLVMRLIRDFLTWRRQSDPEGMKKERMALFYSIHMAVAKMGRASTQQCRKFEKELKEILGTDVALSSDLIATVWKYNKNFINENNALRFFARLRIFVPEEQAIHFHHMFLYAAHQEMSCLKFIIQAIQQFPDFPWYLARSTFRADWNNYELLCQEMWNRPYMAYTGIDARFGSNNYKSLAFLSWCLIISFGTSRDVAANGYVGFSDMPAAIKQKVEELLRYYQQNVMVSIDFSKEYTLEERKEIFDQMEAGVQKFAQAAKIFDSKLQRLQGDEDLLQVSNECLQEADQVVSTIRDSQLLPVRKAGPEAMYQRPVGFGGRGRNTDGFIF